MIPTRNDSLQRINSLDNIEVGTIDSNGNFVADGVIGPVARSFESLDLNTDYLPSRLKDTTWTLTFALAASVKALQNLRAAIETLRCQLPQKRTVCRKPNRTRRKSRPTRLQRRLKRQKK